MKGCMQWNSVYCFEDFAASRDQTQSTRSVGQRLTALSYWGSTIDSVSIPVDVGLCNGTPFTVVKILLLAGIKLSRLDQ